jgi:arabinofuranosyltransferase
MRVRRPGVWLFATVFGLVLVRTAWLCDDAFITLRTVSNFVDGYGLTWNTAERVQSYTHPLWLFVLSAVYAATRDVFVPVLVMSLAISLAAVLVFALGVARSGLAAIPGILALTLSRAFVDYSTSGLENPLTHLLLACFFALFLGAPIPEKTRTLRAISLVACLLALNRMDAFLLVGPAIGLRLWSEGRTRGFSAGAREVLAGFIPLVFWEVFSLFYYGSLVPNTAYAKLGTGLGTVELSRQGGAYLLESLRTDPVTLPLIAAAILLAFATRRPEHAAGASGIGLYALYVVRVGGDFMSGRFLAAPFFVAVMLLCSARAPESRTARLGLFAAAAGLLVLAVSRPLCPIRSGPDYGRGHPGATIDPQGIADERKYYYAYTGLLREERRNTPLNHPFALTGFEARHSGVPVQRWWTVGLTGFAAGPGVYVLDQLALADPLLARLPARQDRPWRIGHFERVIPDGYLETLASGENVLVDRRLASYYDHIRTVVRGPLFGRERLAAIWNLNLGRYDELIDVEAYRHPTAPAPAR